MTVDNVTNTRQDKTSVPNSLTGGSIEGNQADIVPGDSPVVGNLSVEKGDPIDGVSSAKDLELKSKLIDKKGKPKKNPKKLGIKMSKVKKSKTVAKTKKDTLLENQKNNQSGTGENEERF